MRLPPSPRAAEDHRRRTAMRGRDFSLGLAGLAAVPGPGGADPCGGGRGGRGADRAAIRLALPVDDGDGATSPDREARDAAGLAGFARAMDDARRHQRPHRRAVERPARLHRPGRAGAGDAVGQDGRHGAGGACAERGAVDALRAGDAQSAVRSIADFGAGDRIALPAVKLSAQAVALEMAAAKLWGFAAYDRLDALTVTLPHPDAVTALLAGNSPITSHYTVSPFHYYELANPALHAVLKSYDTLGGKHTNGVLVGTKKF